MPIGTYTFVDLKKRALAYYDNICKSNKTVNGSSVSAHVEAAVKQDIAAGMTEEAARIKWKAKPKTEIAPDNDVAYLIRLYNQFFDIRTVGMNGLNPITLHDVVCYENRFGPISEPIRHLLHALDNVYYDNRD